MSRRETPAECAFAAALALALFFTIFFGPGGLAAELADYNRQRNQRMACCETNGVRSCDQGRQCPARMPAEAATHFGTEMHHAYRPVDGWAVELAFATLALLAVGAFAVIGWLTAP